MYVIGNLHNVKLIDSIFAMGGKLLFSTDSDIYFFSFLGSLLSPPYCHLSRRSYWNQLISSSLCSFIYIKHTPWSVFHPLYRHFWGLYYNYLMFITFQFFLFIYYMAKTNFKCRATLYRIIYYNNTMWCRYRGWDLLPPCKYICILKTTELAHSNEITISFEQKPVTVGIIWKENLFQLYIIKKDLMRKMLNCIYICMDVCMFY
jgi:hypothetical protein